MSVKKYHGAHRQPPAGDEPFRAPGGERGFSMIELIFSMFITILILGVAVGTFTSVLSSRTRESSKTDAITSTQAALNIVTREIGNSGYGLTTNGIVLADSNRDKLHFRTNTDNNNGATSAPGEDVTFYFDAASQSVVRYDAYNGGSTSGIINRISDVNFIYHNYAEDGTVTQSNTPSASTARVTIELLVTLADVAPQPAGQKVVVSSDVTLRNSTYMLGQY